MKRRNLCRTKRAAAIILAAAISMISVSTAMAESVTAITDSKDVTQNSDNGADGEKAVTAKSSDGHDSTVTVKGDV
ncbi:MAG: hypothetical protein J6I76_11200 [Oribacterium sp.]|nr:hypothetical protein [Oribacterium sp.]MBP3804442.1 hypothetical protein [Oribacterium sp.]